MVMINVHCKAYILMSKHELLQCAPVWPVNTYTHPYMNPVKYIMIYTLNLN